MQKKDFIYSMKKLKKIFDLENELNLVCKKFDKDFNSFYLSDITDFILFLIEKNINDTEYDISKFIYDKNWGIENNITYDDLYKLIIDKHK